MIPAYQKALEMENVVELKLEQDRKALQKIRRILYQEKNFIINKLIIYLKKELEIDYYQYRIIDINNNIAELLVKRHSQIFMENIQDKEFLDFNAEELIDNRIFKNKDEIVIADLGFDDKLLNLGYFCDSLSYNFLSYSDEIKDKLCTFVNYVITKSIYKK